MAKGKSRLTKEQLDNPKKKTRKRFLHVDVWQKQFGPVSVRAVYDVFQQAFNVEPKNMRKYSFQDCVESLRELENPNYKRKK